MGCKYDLGASVMFVDPDLINHLDRSQAISTENITFIELNQNDPTNIETLGVFKTGTEIDNSIFKTWGPLDQRYYIKYPFTPSYMKKDVAEEEIVHFGDRRSKSEYFNLADCFTEFRPRSGILKAVVPAVKNQVFVDSFRSVNRPRYYTPSINDNFKYWTSWYSDNGNTIGLSDANTGLIDNASPFIIYKEARPANKITVKIQTGMGLASNKGIAGKPDPLTDLTKSSIPEKWKIQYLDMAGTWQDVYVFENYERDILPPETGTIDFGYVIKNPVETLGYDFVFRGYLPTIAHLPLAGRNGEAYCIGADKTNIGILYVWDTSRPENVLTGYWQEYGPIEKEWRVIDPDKSPENYAIKNYVNPPYYNPTSQGIQDGFNHYLEFVVVKGIRIMVEKMIATSRAFDLIELSPRLFINISDSIIQYTVDKAIAEDNALPVGELSASNGSIVLDNSNLMFNVEQAFNPVVGGGSLLAGRINRNTKVLFYDVVRNVYKDFHLYDYIIPIKTLYVLDKPIVVSGLSEATIQLRDLMFRLEEEFCPSIVLKKCSLSKAVATLLDSIGFTNYIFTLPNSTQQTQSANKTIIPYFFVTEDMKITEALQNLAQATQSAMFFDEYNNFVVMPREHFGSDPVYTLRGQTIEGRRPNIEDINGISIDMIADAEIEYTVRELARYPYGPNSLGLQHGGDEAGRFIAGEEGSFLGYKQSVLWNASDVTDISSLSSAVLNSPLSSLPPQYDPSLPEPFSNIGIDVGYWANNMPFAGTVMMNGEIIKYDAQQVSIQGKPYWATSQQHFDELISNTDLRLIDGFDSSGLRTGLLRIWTDLEKDETGTLKIIRHGRGMYGTPITNHEAEPIYWTNAYSYRHADTALQTVFNENREDVLAKYKFAPRALTAAESSQSTGTRSTNYIYNPMHSTYSPLYANPIDLMYPTINRSTDVVNADPLTNKSAVRSSSLVYAGPSTSTPDTVYKKYKMLQGNKYSTFGCRIGIVGIKAVQDATDENAIGEQSPANSMRYASIDKVEDDGTTTSTVIMGAGGGLFFNTSHNVGAASTNDGYYFEITALNGQYDAVPGEGFTNTYVFPNVNFYKINGGTPKTGQTVPAGNVAIPLYSTYMPIGVTTGSQTQRNRIYAADNVVYDLAVDVKLEQLEKTAYFVFYLYVNNILIARVVDSSTSAPGYPLKPQTTEMGFFVRGKSTIQLEHIYAIGGGINDPRTNEPNTFNTDIFKRLPEFAVFSPSTIFTSKALTGGPDNGYRYYDEFGSIVRECKKIDAKYELFPAFIPAVQRMRTIDRAYTVTHFSTTPYKASFMIWSQSDDNLVFGDDVDLQLFIAGLTFADNQPQTLKLDDYLLGRMPGAGPEDQLNLGLQKRNDLLAKRNIGQTTSISLNSIYIQSTDFAKKLMSWLNGFIGEERLRLDVKTFGTPHLQIGDIVAIDYDIPYLAEGELSPDNDWNPTKDRYIQPTFDFYGNDRRFVVRKIGIDGTSEGPEYTYSLVEIPSKQYWNAGDW